MRNRNIIRRYSQKKIFSISTLLCILLCLLFLFACDSSDTRSTAKSATSSETELQVRVTSPVDGATILFVQKEEDGDFSSDVTYTFTTSGGTEPIMVTWLIEGLGYSNTSTSGSELTFLAAGEHTITAIATDSKGLTASNSVRVDIQLAEGGVSGGGSTTTTTATSTTTTTTTTTAT